MFLWQPQRRIESYDEFVESTDRLLRTTVTLLVISLPEEAPAGFVQLYDVNLQNGWAYFLSFLDEPWRARPLAAEASMALLDYAFSHFNLRKVYADVYGFNEPVREMLLARGFTEEGRLARHIFWNGKFWGLHQLALYRETWDEYRRDLRLRLVVRADFEDIESSDT